jgi:uncharacterized protein YndB with AHSA1/START domain
VTGGEKHWRTIFERSLVVRASPRQSWTALTDPRDLEAWTGHAERFEAHPGGSVLFRNPGWEDVHGEVIVCIPERRLTWRAPPDAGIGNVAQSEMDVRLEPVTNGTRITFVERASGQPREADPSAIALGWNESIADLVLFLEHRVRFPRHMTPRRQFGAVTRDTAAGVQIIDVAPGSFAERLRLRAGDIVVRLGEAPLFDRSDLALVLREHREGTKLQATVVRDGRLLKTTATL